MEGVICIDFGTSSIRAAIRNERGNRYVLPLGKISSSRTIDMASIPCEISISRAEGQITFGEAAIQNRDLDPMETISVRSPKLWLNEPLKLSQRVTDQLHVTRFDLLVTFLAYSFDVIFRAAREWHPEIEIAPKKVLIAHPVWQEDPTLSDKAMRQVVSHSYALALKLQGSAVSVADLGSLIAPLESTGEYPSSDVIEPIAAALQICKPDTNRRRLIIVVDVGAGTTDIGMFGYVQTPGKEDRLIRVGSVKSVYKAGNEIDRVLLELIKGKVANHDPLKLAVLENRIRRIKHSLFQHGSVYEMGVEVLLEELEGHPAIIQMSTDIRSALLEIAKERKSLVKEWTQASINQNSYLEIVMAGGGATLTFLKKALGESLKIDNLLVISTKVVQANNDLSMPMFEASIERLAVALGGVHPDYDDLRKEYDTDRLILKSLGGAKQIITSVLRQPQTYLEDTLNQSVTKKISNINNLDSSDKLKLRKWNDLRRDLSKKVSNADPALQYELGMLLIDPPIEAYKKAYRKAALGFLVSAASRGHLGAIRALPGLYSGEHADRKELDQALYWFLVAKGLNDPIGTDEKMERTLKASIKTDLIANAVHRSNQMLGLIKDKCEKPRIVNRSREEQASLQSTSKLHSNMALTNRIKVLELVSKARNMKLPSKFVRMTDLLAWSKNDSAVEAFFLYALCGGRTDSARTHLKEDEYKTLLDWLSLSRGK